MQLVVAVGRGENLKIAPWVTEMPALCVARNAGGKNAKPKQTHTNEM